jgi:hypothetical protein
MSLISEIPFSRSPRESAFFKDFRGHQWTGHSASRYEILKVFGVDANEPAEADFWQFLRRDPAADLLGRYRQGSRRIADG